MSRVLILCTGNSCRSQMAEAIWAVKGDGKWEAHSAGSRPSGYVHPLAVDVMHELNCDLTEYRSKSVDEFAGQEFDLVVTVCDNARDACPAFPGAKKTLHWPFEDPADATGSDEEKKTVFRKVRDQIQSQVESFLKSGANP